MHACTQGDAPFTLPSELGSLKKLKRVNLSGLELDDVSKMIAVDMKKACLSKPDGIFWGVDGVKTP